MKWAGIGEALVRLEPFYVCPFGLALVLLSPFIPKPFVWIGLVITLVPWALRLARGHRLSVRTPLDVPWAFFLASALLGLLVSIDFWLGMERLYGILGGLGLYYMVVNNWSEKHLKTFLFLLLTISSLIAVLGLRQAPLESLSRSRLIWLKEGVDRVVPGVSVSSIDVSYNGIAYVLAIPLPLAASLAFLPYSRRSGKSQGRSGVERQPSDEISPVGVLLRKHGSPAPSFLLRLPAALAGLREVPFFRLLCLLAFAIMLVLLVLTSSRGGFLGLLSAVVVCLVVLNRRFLLLVPVVAAAGYWFVMEFISYPERLLDPTNGVGRLELWQSVYYMLQDFPYTGIGLGSFTYVYPLYSLPSTWGSGALHSHNVFLQTYLEQGVLGLASWVVVLCVVGLAIVRLIGLSQRGTLHHGLGTGLAGSFAAFLVHGLFDVSTTGAFLDGAGALHMYSSPVLYFLAALAIGSTGDVLRDTVRSSTHGQA